MNTAIPTDIDATLNLLGQGDYIAERSLATTLFLALKMGRPLFLEGEAGVGKTEIAKVLSETLSRTRLSLKRGRLLGQGLGQGPSAAKHLVGPCR